MAPADDLNGRLARALAEVEAAGFGAAAQAARDACFAAYTTSSELRGEVTIALRKLLASCGASLPERTRQDLRGCLDDVAGHRGRAS